MSKKTRSPPKTEAAKKTLARKINSLDGNCQEQARFQDREADYSSSKDERERLLAAGQILPPMLASLHVMKNKRTVDVRLFLFCAVLSAHRIKDASPQLRLTFSKNS
jgi:hypothetical protein